MRLCARRGDKSSCCISIAASERLENNVRRGGWDVAEPLQKPAGAINSGLSLISLIDLTKTCAAAASARHHPPHPLWIHLSRRTVVRQYCIIVVPGIWIYDMRNSRDHVFLTLSSSDWITAFNITRWRDAGKPYTKNNVNLEGISRHII